MMRRITAVLIILVLSLSVGAGVLAQQDPKAPKRVKAANFEEVLRPFIGMKCSIGGAGGLVFLDFANPKATETLDMVGKDFVRLSGGRVKFYYPFTSIRGLFTR